MCPRFYQFPSGRAWWACLTINLAKWLISHMIIAHSPIVPYLSVLWSSFSGKDWTGYTFSLEAGQSPSSPIWHKAGPCFLYKASNSCRCLKTRPLLERLLEITAALSEAIKSLETTRSVPLNYDDVSIGGKGVLWASDMGFDFR